MNDWLLSLPAATVTFETGGATVQPSQDAGSVDSTSTVSSPLPSFTILRVTIVSSPTPTPIENDL